jgi:hypothetical protein
MEALVKLSNAINHIGGITGFKPSALVIEIDARLFPSTYETITRNLLAAAKFDVSAPPTEVTKTPNTFSFVYGGVKITYARTGLVDIEDKSLKDLSAPRVTDRINDNNTFLSEKGRRQLWGLEGPSLEASPSSKLPKALNHGQA